MAYRDDKEAAYARADALQRELDRAQNELAQTKGKLAAAEHARDSLARRVLSRDPGSVEPPPLPAPPVRRSGVAALGSLAVIGAMSALAMNRHHSYDYTPPPPIHFEVPPIEVPNIDVTQLAMPAAPDPTPFTIDSKPSGAQIVSVTGSGSVVIGTTPMTQSVSDWSIWGTLAIDAKGYARMIVDDAPWTDKANPDHAVLYRLTRRK